MRLSMSAAACAAIAFCAAAASAQTTAIHARGYLVVNGGYQATSNNFQQSTVYRRNAEDGSLQTNYSVKSGPMFDIAGGGILWRRLGIGVDVSRFALSTPMQLTAAVPHPFFFNQPRTVTGDVGGLQREELAVHVQARAIVPVGARFEVMLFGGPSLFRVKQDFVTDVAYTESYPYDTASFSSATTTAESKSKIGFNAGGDVAFFFTRQVGVGATVQFSGATVGFTGPNRESLDVKAGGLQAGGGLRLRF